MRIVVFLKQVPDLVEELEIAPDGKDLDRTYLRYILNESDDHALEQAVLLKERMGAEVHVFTPDLGEADEVLYHALARGADRAGKITGIPFDGLSSHRYAELAARLLEGWVWDLVFTGCQAVDDLDGQLGPLLAARLGLPYVGLVTRVAHEGERFRVHKEFPRGLLEVLDVTPPAVLGILTAEEMPRYVPVSRLRSVMQSATIEEIEVAAEETETGLEILRFSRPEVPKGAEILSGPPEEVAEKIVEILMERGLVH